ncbi:MAG TPA: hypothetical protein PKN32_12245 [Bacteroidales bacterium]|nr:hypothetical protein [Bacteroidales bacterium]
MFITSFNSCNKIGQKSEWNNLILVNSFNYTLPDEFEAVATFSDNGYESYIIPCKFIKSSDTIFVLSSPIVLPEKAVVKNISLEISINGWYLYAQTDSFSNIDFSPDNEIRLNISCGEIRLTYISIYSIDSTSASYKFKIEDFGTDSLLDILVRLRTEDEDGEIIKDSIFPPVCGLHDGIFKNLQQGQRYCLKINAHYVNGYRCLATRYFNTTPPPIPLTVITSEVTDITRTSACLNGKVYYTVDTVNVVERGFVWGLVSNPSIESNTGCEVGGSGPGIMSITVSTLLPSKIYYVRTYAKLNNSDIVYGNELSFSTMPLELAEVANVTVNLITATTAYCYSYVINNGGSSISDKGFVYSLDDNPSFEGYFGITHQGGGESSFHKTITELWPNTTFYIRAFAVNDVGVSYGNVISFRTENEKKD